MPSLEGSRDTVWPELCRAMHVWLKENEAQRALIIDTDRPSWGGYLTRLCMDNGWLHYAFVFVGREKGGYEAYFIASVCSFRLTLQKNWQSSFVCAWIVTIPLFMLASHLHRSDPIMAWLRKEHHTNDGWSTSDQSDNARQG